MLLSGHRKYPLGSRNPCDIEKSLFLMQKAIDFSCAVGIRIIQLAGYDVYYEAGDEITRANFLVNLKKCVEMAGRAGVIIAFETMETDFMNTVRKASICTAVTLRFCRYTLSETYAMLSKLY